MNKIIVGLTGASGSVYCKNFVESLLEKNYNVHLIATEMGEKVFSYELKTTFKDWAYGLSHRYEKFKLEEVDNLFSGVASGSNKYDAVVILPCSMGTLASIAGGISTNLLTRVADVAIKERRKMVVVPREAPFSSIHLENMLKLSREGVSIIPAMPGFYHHPETVEDVVDFVVGKIMDHLGIENNKFEKWKDQ